MNLLLYYIRPSSPRPRDCIHKRVPTGPSTSSPSQIPTRMELHLTSPRRTYCVSSEQSRRAKVRARSAIRQIHYATWPSSPMGRVATTHTSQPSTPTCRSSPPTWSPVKSSRSYARFTLSASTKSGPMTHLPSVPLALAPALAGSLPPSPRHATNTCSPSTFSPTTSELGSTVALSLPSMQFCPNVTAMSFEQRSSSVAASFPPGYCSAWT
mmetsp:Transcript_532/g.696  ORF Transcript_532/g.696 Transcript_532/m.696 type:complete len:211 (-) Transcript_532:2247-2879(-)